MNHSTTPATIESPFPSALPEPTLDTSGAWAPFDPPWSECRADQDLLACPLEHMLPPQCVKCGGRADQRITSRLHWHNPWLYALVPLSMFIYVIVAMIVRKTAVLEVGLCARHLRRRRNGRIAGWLVALGGLGLALTGTGLAIMGGLAVILVGVTIAMIAGRVVRPRRMDDLYVWLSGVHPAVLARLPPA